MGKTLLLTGDPGIGKTTLIRQTVEALGDRAGGFYTQEIAGPGGRKGFQLITLDGQTAVLSHKDLRGPKVPQVGRYGVDLAVLERVGVTALQQAAAAGQIVIVDEIGKMELLSPRFRQALMELILGPAVILGTIIAKPHPEGDAFKRLAPVTIWEVNYRTRDTLAAKILEWLKKATTGSARPQAQT